MSIYKNCLEKINDLFNINLRNDDCIDNIFVILKEIINFNSAYIFYISPVKLELEHSFNNKLGKKNFKDLNSINFTDEFIIHEYLTIEDTPFAIICISRNSNYSKEEISIFKTVSGIIANLIKNIELNNIISLQIQAQQESIIELNKAYKTIQKQNKKILKADKIKNDFLSHVSHELRTPLNSIIGFSDLLSAGCCGELNKKQVDYINDIKISGLHLLGMINEILDISKIESNAITLNKTTFDISLAINEVINIVNPLAIKKRITISTDIKSTILKADYQKFQQILFNLLSNAIKFTQEQGHIIITVKNEQNNLILSVKDNGIGIDKKYHKKIFNKFEQCSKVDNPNSTGLGLTITKELVKLHNGKINLISEPNKGTEFIIKIPC